MMQFNILLFLVAFYKFFHRKMVKNTHFYPKMAWPHATHTSYFVAIATDCCETLVKYVLRISEQLLKTA